MIVTASATAFVVICCRLNRSCLIQDDVIIFRVLNKRTRWAQSNLSVISIFLDWHPIAQRLVSRQRPPSRRMIHMESYHPTNVLDITYQAINLEYFFPNIHTQKSNIKRRWYRLKYIFSESFGICWDCVRGRIELNFGLKSYQNLISWSRTGFSYMCSA